MVSAISVVDRRLESRVPEILKTPPLGRHKPSASTSTASTSTDSALPALSGSSTFRRLPSLARPFRRNPDKDKDKGKEASGDAIVEESEGGSGHQRTSTFPSLSRVVADSPNSSNLSSNLLTPFSTPAAKARPPEDTAAPISTSSSLWPPSRKSSLHPSASPGPSSEQPVSHPPLSPFPRKESMRDAMVASMAPPVPVLSSQSLDDMGHVAYPSHLAQRLPPEAGPGPSSTSTAASTPISATPIVTPSAIRAISRNRDFTMGTPIRNSHERERSISKEGPRDHGEELGPEPGPGGPPTGVPRRKESIQASTSSMPTPDNDAIRESNGNGNTAESRRLDNGRSRLVSKNGPRGDSEHDTDSGGGERAPNHTRRRAGTKSASDRPRDMGTSGNDNTPTPTSGEKDTTPRIRKSSKPNMSNSASTSSPSTSNSTTTRPALPCARGVSRVPASSMYFSLLPYHGRPPAQPLRAHTGTLVGDRIWVIGGVDAKHCWRGVARYDTESLLWTTVETAGETLPPLRAHTTTAVGDRLYVFGGGDGPTYSNEVWSFDTSKLTSASPSQARPGRLIFGSDTSLHQAKHRYSHYILASTSSSSYNRTLPQFSGCIWRWKRSSGAE